MSLPFRVALDKTFVAIEETFGLHAHLYSGGFAQPRVQPDTQVRTFYLTVRMAVRRFTGVPVPVTP